MNPKRQLHNLVQHLKTFPGLVATASARRSLFPHEWSLPYPTVAWAVIGLIQYRRRKRWAWRVAHARLGPRLRRHLDSSGQGYVTVDEVLAGSEQGTVPDLPGWEYSFDGNESYLRTLRWTWSSDGRVLVSGSYKPPAGSRWRAPSVAWKAIAVTEDDLW